MKPSFVYYQMNVVQTVVFFPSQNTAKCAGMECQYSLSIVHSLNHVSDVLHNWIIRKLILHWCKNRNSINIFDGMSLPQNWLIIEKRLMDFDQHPKNCGDVIRTRKRNFTWNNGCLFLWICTFPFMDLSKFPLNFSSTWAPLVLKQCSTPLSPPLHILVKSSPSNPVCGCSPCYVLLTEFELTKAFFL